MSLRLAIVDDEAPARARLRRLLAAHADIEVVLDCDALESALARLPEAGADAVILDIGLGEADAFELLARLPPPWPQLVFATAFHQHALRAFELAAVDYLLKPFDADRLADTLGRLRMRCAEDAHTRTAPAAQPPAGVPSADAGRLRASLVVYERGQRCLVPLAAITHMVGSGNYVELHTPQRRYLMRTTLTQLEHELDPACFLRVHRSHLVRADQIASVTPRAHGDAAITLRDGTCVLASRRYREALPEAVRGR